MISHPLFIVLCDLSSCNKVQVIIIKETNPQKPYETSELTEIKYTNI